MAVRSARSFSAFDEQALGSASIAQAHAAVLCSGESVVVKVQRDGIHDVMSRDIILLKRACKMLEYTPPAAWSTSIRCWMRCGSSRRRK